MRLTKSVFFTLLFAHCVIAHADGSAVDKVYHPYVQPLEREIEWRFVSHDGEQKHRLGIGKAVTDTVFIEGYMIASNRDDGIDAFEVETQWQLTEQGEYSVDWALLGELEKEVGQNNWEFASSVIAEKQWRNWVGTANLKLIYEWGESVKEEVESVLAMQVRYRYSRFFEPALEVYSGETTRGMGPVMLGDIRLGAGKSIHWETGLIVGVDAETPDTTWRFLTEFEF